MRSILSVTDAARTTDLTTLESVIAELKPGRRVTKETLRRWIHEASDQVASYCGRVLARETVEETFWIGEASRAIDKIRLTRWPLYSVASVTLDGVSLTEGEDWRGDYGRGFLFRLSSSTSYGRTEWIGTELVVTYTGGYDLVGDLDRDIERAVWILLRNRLENNDRNPLVRSESVPGVFDISYQVGTISKDPSMPDEAAGLLSRFREVEI